MHIQRKLLICLALSLVVAVAQPASAQSFKWWQMERFQKGLSLKQEQIDRIEAIFRGILTGAPRLPYRCPLTPCRPSPTPSIR